MVGSGDSMLPLYKDHTIIVTQKVDSENLQAGMTVVFVGDSGFPVAHVLVKHTSEGWISMGVGNQAPDRGRVRDENLIGLVVAAYEPTSSPMLALLETSAAAQPMVATLASNQ